MNDPQVKAAYEAFLTGDALALETLLDALQERQDEDGRDTLRSRLIAIRYMETGKHF